MTHGFSHGVASEAWSFIISARLELSLFVAALVVPALSGASEESESLVKLDDLPGLVNIQKAMDIYVYGFTVCSMDVRWILPSGKLTVCDIENGL